MPYDRAVLPEHPREKMSAHELEHSLATSPAEQRLLKRALGCGVEELIARFGAEHAIARVQAELWRARRARSRKLYTLWTAVRARIEADMARHDVMMRQSVTLKDASARSAIQADHPKQIQIGG